jgi:hypothetical protein
MVEVGDFYLVQPWKSFMSLANHVDKESQANAILHVTTVEKIEREIVKPRNRFVPIGKSFISVSKIDFDSNINSKTGINFEKSQANAWSWKRSAQSRLVKRFFGSTARKSHFAKPMMCERQTLIDKMCCIQSESVHEFPTKMFQKT